MHARGSRDVVDGAYLVDGRKIEYAFASAKQIARGLRRRRDTKPPRQPSQKADEIGARLCPPSSLTVLTRTTGVPRYKMGGSATT